METQTEQPGIVATEIANALLSAQCELKGAAESSVNPHFGNSYADLSAVIDATIPILNKHGIVVLQTPIVPPYQGCLALKTVLLHVSGQSVSSTAVLPLSKQDPQAYGSALTYARRYSLAAIIGLKTFDDDAEGAQGRGPAQSQQRPPANQKPPASRPPARPAAIPPPKQLEQLIQQKGIPGDMVQKWLDKAGVNDLDQLPADVLTKCIAYARTYKRPANKAAA